MKRKMYLMPGQLYVSSILAFLFINIVIAEIAVGIPAKEAFIFNRLLAIFAFLIVKIVTQGQKLVRLFVYTYFCYFNCKNYNSRVAASMPVVKAFLFNTFLAIFIF